MSDPRDIAERQRIEVERLLIRAALVIRTPESTVEARDEAAELLWVCARALLGRIDDRALAYAQKEIRLHQDHVREVPSLRRGA